MLCRRMHRFHKIPDTRGENAIPKFETTPTTAFVGMYGLIASCVAESTNAGLTLSARKVEFCSDSEPRSTSVSPLTLAKIGENRPGF